MFTPSPECRPCRNLSSFSNISGLSSRGRGEKRCGQRSPLCYQRVTVGVLDHKWGMGRFLLGEVSLGEQDLAAGLTKREVMLRRVHLVLLLLLLLVLLC